MIYLLDANVLMTAHDNYYPLDTVPQFWDWLIATGREGHIKIPHEIYGEVTTSTNELGAWAKQKHVREALELVESVDLNALQQVFDQGYGTYLTDADYEKMGKDPFLIAYALSKGYTVITKETPKPSAQKGNRKVPDVCNSVGVTWARDFPIFKALGFKIT